MKEEVERKKDEVKNMTMMILNDDRGFEGENSGMILGELEQEGSDREERDTRDVKEREREKMGQSMMQLRNNLSTLNQTQKLNTTVNFINRIIVPIKCRGSWSKKSTKTISKVHRTVTSWTARSYQFCFQTRWRGSGRRGRRQKCRTWTWRRFGSWWCGGSRRWRRKLKLKGTISILQPKLFNFRLSWISTGKIWLTWCWNLGWWLTKIRRCLSIYCSFKAGWKC